MQILTNFAKFLIVSFLAISISQAKNKTEWYKTFENESSAFYVDTYMLIYDNGYRMFWMVEDLKKPYLEKYNSILSYRFLDCSKKSSKTFKSFAYNGKQANGEQILNLPVDKDWIDNSKITFLKVSSDLICNDPYLLSKTKGL